MCLTLLYISFIVFGGGYLFISFIIGEVVDFGEDVGHAFEGATDSITGMFESIGDALDGIFGGAEAVDVDVGEVDIPIMPDFGEVEDIDTGPSPFGLRTIATFVAGFGAGGIIGIGLQLPELLTLAPASGVGLVSGGAMWTFLRFLYGEQGTTSIQAPDYLGLIGRVIIPIPEGKPGQVALVVKGQRKNVSARSKNGAPIPGHTQVEVVSMEGGIVIVKEIK